MMDGRERNGVAWRERGKKQGGANGSKMQPLCHGNAVKFVIASQWPVGRKGDKRDKGDVGAVRGGEEVLERKSSAS